MLPLLAAGIGLQAGASILQGFLGASEKKSEKALAKYNAALMEQQAKSVEQRTKFQQARQAEEAQRVMGGLQATLGASGMVAGEGVGAMVQAKQRSELELENLMIGQEGLIEASQARSQGGVYRMQASMLGQQARNTIWGGFLGAGSAIGQGLMYANLPSSGGGDSYGSSWFKKAKATASKSDTPTGGFSRSMIG